MGMVLNGRLLPFQTDENISIHQMYVISPDLSVSMEGLSLDLKISRGKKEGITDRSYEINVKEVK